MSPAARGQTSLTCREPLLHGMYNSEVLMAYLALVTSFSQVTDHHGFEESPSCPPSSFAALSIALCCNRSKRLGSFAAGRAYCAAYGNGSGSEAAALAAPTVPTTSKSRFLFVPTVPLGRPGPRTPGPFEAAGLRGGRLREACVGWIAAWRYCMMIAPTVWENLIEIEPLQSQLSLVLRGAAARN